MESMVLLNSAEYSSLKKCKEDLEAFNKDSSRVVLHSRSYHDGRHSEYFEYLGKDTVISDLIKSNDGLRTQLEFLESQFNSVNNDLTSLRADWSDLNSHMHSLQSSFTRSIHWVFIHHRVGFFVYVAVIVVATSVIGYFL